jgi:hypothetical protein
LNKGEHMMTLRRTLLATSLAAAGLLGAGSLAQAEEPDVSTIYGRASPPNTHIVAAGWDSTGPQSAAAVEPEAAPAMERAGQDYPIIVARETTNPATATPPSATAVASDSEYLTTPSNAGASETVITPTGKYLAVDRSTAAPASDTAMVHEENLDGVPLVDGRGVRQGIDIGDYAATVQTEPAFDVADVLGRSSPPAPEGAEPYFGVGG